jgi:hypothetical protein
MPGELRKAEIHEPVQLTDPVPEVLPQPIAEPHQLAQLLDRPSGSRLAAGRLCAAKRAIPTASIASVCVRWRSSPAKRRVRSGFNSATAKPAATSAANRFFQ